MSITTEDRRALDGLRDLDQQVIGAVYDQYFSEIYRYVLYRIGDVTLAEDIASDVFVRLLEAAQNNKAPQTNIKGWLIATASHVRGPQLLTHFPVSLPTSNGFRSKTVTSLHVGHSVEILCS